MKYFTMLMGAVPVLYILYMRHDVLLMQYFSLFIAVTPENHDKEESNGGLVSFKQ